MKLVACGLQTADARVQAPDCQWNLPVHCHPTAMMHFAPLCGVTTVTASYYVTSTRILYKSPLIDHRLYLTTTYSTLHLHPYLYLCSLFPFFQNNPTTQQLYIQSCLTLPANLSLTRLQPPSRYGEILQSCAILTVTCMQPDSEKSTTEHAGDTLKGKGDSLASSVQPQVRFFT